MNAFAAIVFERLLSRLGYQMARSPVLPAFAAGLGARPEFIGVIVAASTVIGVFFKLPSGSQVLFPRTGYEAHPMLDWHTCDPLPI
jgi:hypothetical protein